MRVNLRFGELILRASEVLTLGLITSNMENESLIAFYTS